MVLKYYNTAGPNDILQVPYNFNGSFKSAYSLEDVAGKYYLSLGNSWNRSNIRRKYDSEAIFNWSLILFFSSCVSTSKLRCPFLGRNTLYTVSLPSWLPYTSSTRYSTCIFTLPAIFSTPSANSGTILVYFWFWATTSSSECKSPSS